MFVKNLLRGKIRLTVEGETHINFKLTRTDNSETAIIYLSNPFTETQKETTLEV